MENLALCIQAPTSLSHTGATISLRVSALLLALDRGTLRVTSYRWNTIR